MREHSRVVIIGGGVIGCSILYHLTKFGWSDVTLLERKELTAGSSWHAAGGFHTFNGDPNVARLQAYTCGLYREIEALSGQDVGARYVGGVLVASTPERWEFFRAAHARHRALGIECELIGPDEVRKLCPIMDVRDVIGAIYDPLEGYVDPSGATHAYAKAARAAGATIHRQTKVEALSRRPDGRWEVVTDKGTIVADHVVNAAGLWAREVGQMAGVSLPLVPMEHHYLVTEAIPELAGLSQEIAQTADFDAGLYLRQERDGVLLGVYEREPLPWAIDGTPWDYAEDELLIPDLDRLGEDLMRGFARFPAVAAAGIKRVVNGPFTFTPDGNPLLGPIANLPGYWVACGVMAGFAQGGGVGRTIAEWIVEGQPSLNVFAMDVARFDPKIDQPTVIAQARQFYARRFDIPYPNEVWEAGRPAKTSPLYTEQKARGAVFAISYGLEIPAYFMPAGWPGETPSFRRSASFTAVADECRAVREAVAVLEISAFAKFAVSGADAEAFARKINAAPMPASGNAARGLPLSGKGRPLGDLTVIHREAGNYLLIGSSSMQGVLARWFAQQGAGQDLRIENLSEELAGLFVTGPAAIGLLDELTDGRRIGSSLSEDAFERRAIKSIPCEIVRSDPLGYAGYEIYTPTPNLVALYRTFLEEGAALGIRDMGVAAYTSLVIESSPDTTARELTPDATIAELGLEGLPDPGRSDYIGASAVEASRGTEPTRKLVLLKIASCDADPVGHEPVWLGDACVGHVTSGGYGHGVSCTLARALVDRTAITETHFEVSILGDRHAAEIFKPSIPRD